tara:strand:+ start:56 stop:274 length:219 start_codon:yes stop_codon:yes gene_type:complete
VLEIPESWFTTSNERPGLSEVRSHQDLRRPTSVGNKKIGYERRSAEKHLEVRPFKKKQKYAKILTSTLVKKT